MKNWKNKVKLLAENRLKSAKDLIKLIDNKTKMNIAEEMGKIKWDGTPRSPTNKDREKFIKLIKEKFPEVIEKHPQMNDWNMIAWNEFYINCWTWE